MKTALLILLLPFACLAQHPLVTGAGIDWRSGLPSSGLSPVAGAFVWYVSTNGVVGSTGASPPADAERIKSWTDLSGNAFHLTNLAASTVGPQYKAASHIANGVSSATNPPSNVPYIYFDSGANVYLTNKFGTTFSQPNTYFYVANGEAGRSSTPVLNPVANQNQQITWPPGQAQPTLFAGSAQSGPLTYNANANDNNYVIYAEVFDGTSSELWSNNVQLNLSGTTVGTGALQGITLGNFFNLSAGSGNNLLIVEFVGYNSHLSHANLTAESRYLAQKYGLKSVP